MRVYLCPMRPVRRARLCGYVGALDGEVVSSPCIADVVVASGNPREWVACPVPYVRASWLMRCHLKRRWLPLACNKRKLVRDATRWGWRACKGVRGSVMFVGQHGDVASTCDMLHERMLQQWKVACGQTLAIAPEAA